MPIQPQSWKCPFCNHHSTLTSSNIDQTNFDFFSNNKHGHHRLFVVASVCPNPNCGEFTLKAELKAIDVKSEVPRKVTVLENKARWSLVPASNAVPMPNYVPAPIVADYIEACLIRDLSPKASATLARRCLQGMIRDFWGIQKNRLLDEVNALKDKVESLTWEAIDAVRSIGNIGAHMEKDINTIVEVDPNEANALLELIETLVEDWYMTRFEREQRLNRVVNVAAQKKLDKNATK